MEPPDWGVVPRERVAIWARARGHVLIARLVQLVPAGWRRFAFRVLRSCRSSSAWTLQRSRVSITWGISCPLTARSSRRLAACASVFPLPELAIAAFVSLLREVPGPLRTLLAWGIWLPIIRGRRAATRFALRGVYEPDRTAPFSTDRSARRRLRRTPWLPFDGDLRYGAADVPSGGVRVPRVGSSLGLLVSCRSWPSIGGRRHPHSVIRCLRRPRLPSARFSDWRCRPHSHTRFFVIGSSTSGSCCGSACSTRWRGGCSSRSFRSRARSSSPTSGSTGDFVQRSCRREDGVRGLAVFAVIAIPSRLVADALDRGISANGSTPSCVAAWEETRNAAVSTRLYCAGDQIEAALILNLSRARTTPGQASFTQVAITRRYNNRSHLVVEPGDRASAVDAEAGSADRDVRGCPCIFRRQTSMAVAHGSDGGCRNHFGAEKRPRHLCAGTEALGERTA